MGEVFSELRFDRQTTVWPILGRPGRRVFLVEDIDLTGRAGSVFYGTFTNVSQDFLGSVLVRFVLVVGGDIDVNLCRAAGPQGDLGRNLEQVPVSLHDLISEFLGGSIVTHVFRLSEIIAFSASSLVPV